MNPKFFTVDTSVFNCPTQKEVLVVLIVSTKGVLMLNNDLWDLGIAARLDEFREPVFDGGDECSFSLCNNPSLFRGQWCCGGSGH